MRFKDTYVSKEHRYWLGIDTKTGRYYAAIPVVNQMIDYVESYWISESQYKEFLENQPVAIEFVQGCRRREHDDLLVFKPGSDRGTPA
jgi:hypothetical protein